MGASRDLMAWAGCLAFSVSGAAAYAMQQLPDTTVVSDVQHQHVHFDIRPQPLVTALRSYSETTGLAILVDDGLTQGRQSPGAQGDLTAAEGLRQVLKETGLQARYASANAFTLTAIAGQASGAAPAPAGTAAPLAETALERYAGILQRGVVRALCGTEESRPGKYRLALQLWIDPSGRVGRTRLLDDGSAVERDARIVAQLNELLLEAPPETLPQPVTLLLLPRPSGAAFDCQVTRPLSH